MTFIEERRKNPWPGQVMRHVTTLESYEGNEVDERPVADADIATVITSEVSGNPLINKPVLDLDFPCALVPSSTEGHFHLFMDRPLTNDQYTQLLECLAEVGVIEPGYARASIRRGYTSVRLPWIKKVAKS